MRCLKADGHISFGLGCYELPDKEPGVIEDIINKYARNPAKSTIPAIGRQGEQKSQIDTCFDGVSGKAPFENATTPATKPQVPILDVYADMVKKMGDKTQFNKKITWHMTEWWMTDKKLYENFDA